MTAALALGKALGRANVISMDVGGTSCDICLIADGRPAWTVEGGVAGVPLRVPMLDVHSIGAGGGSIVWVDGGGALRLGPRSAGATPGPACYARGGTDATLTDAHVWLGTVRPEVLADKGISADPALAEAALGRVGARASLDLAATARGALRLMQHHLVQGIYAVSVARGHDPRDFALVAFGGAGPLHACGVAAELGMREVVFPLAPGVFSALGAALADTRYDVVQSHVRRWSDLDHAALAALFTPLDAAATARLGEAPAEARVLERSLDLRYVGQSFELNVALDDWPRATPDEIAARFHALHAETWGYSDPSEPVQLVNLRVTGRVPSHVPAVRLRAAGEARRAKAVRVRAPEGAAAEETWALVHRLGLAAGERFAGPALVVDPSATGMVPAGWQAVADAMGSLLVTR
ncbi:MAG: hydantoinase/oxoprolinase family protein [Chloroflexi bacterium]|nr:hydantoinase/oxoprolinase family protein [Chloroflexota bacterium]